MPLRAALLSIGGSEIGGNVGVRFPASIRVVAIIQDFYKACVSILVGKRKFMLYFL